MRRSSVIVPALLIFSALAAAANGMNDQNQGEPQQQQQVIASPNPSIDDGKAPADAGPSKVEATKVQPARGNNAAPMKTTKSKRRRPRPRRD